MGAPTWSQALHDLLLRRKGKLFGVACKRVDAPWLTPSIRIALEDLPLERVAVVYPGSRRYALANNPLHLVKGVGERSEPGGCRASAAMRFANELAHTIMRGQKRKPWTPASRSMPLAVCLDLQVSGTENLRPVLGFSQVSCLPVRICRHPARRISLWISGVKLGPPTG